jgi:hypothetical protein
MLEQIQLIELHERLRTQLQEATTPTHQPFYGEVVLGLIAFSLLFSQFVYQQVVTEANYLAYQEPVIQILSK